MSVVAAMTMDDQRPLLNTYDKMSKQYEQNLHVGSHAGNNSGAPPSGPASPTPSGSEEPPTAQQHPYHHAHHHHHHHSHQQQQQQYHHTHHHNHHQTTLAEQQQQQHQPKHQHHEQQLLLQQQQQTVEQQVQQQQESSVVAEAVAAAEQRQRLLEDEIESLKVEQTRLSLQCADAQRREKILMRRLANKEQEFQDYVTQIAEYKAAQAPSAVALRSALLDPAVNLLFEKLKKELKATKAKLEETQNELSAWKFTPDSNTGKRLMAKCRLLYQENEELGKMTSNGRLAKLETELAMQKSFSEEVKKSQSELDDFLQELDEDVEGMQSTILFLQQELKTTRERIQVLEKENCQLKNNDLKENDVVNDNMTTTDATSIITNTSISTLPLNCSNDVNNVVIPYQLPAAVAIIASAAANNDYKYQLLKQQAAAVSLETIEENECLRTHSGEYYNGVTDEQHQLLQQQQQQQILTAIPTVNVVGGGLDDCGSNNSSQQLRTLASRKRNFDDTTVLAAAAPTECIIAQALPTNIQTTMQQQQVSSPRTLPPKKSKLRLTTSRSSDQIDELVGGEAALMNNCSSSSSSIVTNQLFNSPTTTPINIIDNAVAGMANEELTTNVIVENVNNEVIPQRIMTRRRSVRMQQNGNGNGNGLAGDVSH